ncbi:unnamed protein product [Brassicogethes aeneus]|uniref:Uncharacterized protein n=1 Tax=Brassicogethes aeneus TaxID=1431903 RepID=A0A9P0AR07_BRAAE|nr:unnamed protein product [Brassicogethes aeneus]
MQLTFLINLFFLGYILEATKCDAEDKVHIKIHIPLKQPNYLSLSLGHKKQVVLYKHGHHHRQGHKHDHDHKHKHGHKHHHKHKAEHHHKHNNQHKHMGKHKHVHKQKQVHGHKHHHHESLVMQGPKFQNIKSQVETISDPIEVSPRKKPEGYKDYSHWRASGQSQGYKVMEHDPLDTTTKLFKNLLSTTLSPVDLENDKDAEYENYEDKEPTNEYSDDEHPEHIQEYIDNSMEDLENYADYDYTEPKIQYAEKLTLPDGKYEWNSNELNKYLEQTYGTKHKEGEYDDYLNEASNKVEHQVTPLPDFKVKVLDRDVIVSSTTVVSTVNGNDAEVNSSASKNNG